MRISILAVLAIVSMLIACSNKDAILTNGNGQADIRHVWWKLESFEPVAGGSITLAPTTDYYLVFVVDTTISGKTDSLLFPTVTSERKCNASLSGKDSLCGNTYDALSWVGNNGSLRVGPIITTKVGCRSSYSYMDYLRALGEATSFQITNNKLTVFHSGGTKKLEFVKR